MAEKPTPNDCDPSVSAEELEMPGAHGDPIEVAECQGTPLEATYRDVRLIGGSSGGSVDALGFYPEQNIGEIPEPRSCLDVYIRMPQPWQADASVVLRVYASSETAETLVHSVLLTNVVFRFDIANKVGVGLVRFRSAMPHAWRVKIATSAGAPNQTPGEVSLIAWGKESNTPDVAGEDGGQRNISPGPFVTRHSLLMAWNGINSRWQKLSMDGSGNLLVALGGGGTLTVAGSHTVSSTSTASPTDAVNSQSFTQVWQPSSSSWVPLVVSSGGQLHCLVEGFNSTASGVNWTGASTLSAILALTRLQNDSVGGVFDTFARSNNRGDLLVDFGLPDPTSTSQSPSPINNSAIAFFQKGAPGHVLTLIANNASATALYLLIVNKAAVPVAADPAIQSLWVPAGTSRDLQFLRALFCSTGIAFAWSTTPITVTLAGATGGSVSGTYV